MYFDEALTADDPEVMGRLGLGQYFAAPLDNIPRVQLTGELLPAFLVWRVKRQRLRAEKTTSRQHKFHARRSLQGDSCVGSHHMADGIRSFARVLWNCRRCCVCLTEGDASRLLNCSSRYGNALFPVLFARDRCHDVGEAAPRIVKPGLRTDPTSNGIYTRAVRKISDGDTALGTATVLAE